MIRIGAMPLLIAAVVAVLAAGLPARADWRDTVKVLRIGVVVGANPIERLKQLEPFRRRISVEAGLPVEFVPAIGYASLIDAHATGRIDYAIYSAAAYGAASALCGCIEPIAAPASADGSLSYRAVIVVRADAATETIDDLKGKSLILGRSGATAGDLVPMAEIAAAGIEPAAFFSRIRHADGPKAAIRTVLAGLGDAAVAWEPEGGTRGPLADLTASGEIAGRDLRVVWRSRPIAHGPHAVSRRLPQPLKDRLRSALLRLKSLDRTAYDAVERHFGGGFSGVAEDAYLPMVEVFAPAAKVPAAAPPAGAGPDNG
ncbi:phosphate/phosphite/phosphonate ABC transporter substrate-binding protein [Rhodobium gokarnense]|uniref:Phosphonate transport system substrate-binding protein n=1 Tax=Rhodobium gokarnense TaxID=364296 RepID=A0ABT3H850_9HYPH|nr:phosphate/phosphite/phosphonate ABC transporter substrate-binding protein [Rhodobium gokarnense]MCW2306509.1 phosphonate transport system substrate-binding protein [Rhodobium gokarnense]